MIFYRRPYIGKRWRDSVAGENWIPILGLPFINVNWLVYAHIKKYYKYD